MPLRGSLGDAGLKSRVTSKANANAKIMAMEWHCNDNDDRKDDGKGNKDGRSNSRSPEEMTSRKASIKSRGQICSKLNLAGRC